ncbi:hypothetical protein DLE60_03440 [Micromonospora globispora]|uniref:trypco2 family protein n=1 Tax=Micromonospora globispora TaxID=1450148 RepID=UPI000D6F7727|nr:trypco2 family protein [Micromonospora globispora]PWU61863.1 hypothetical protein DLE60_03440 [Micromonospora globispora]RQW98454.1 hypothetical protein DKL51_10395 [Micromonospora globispora]
MEITDTGVAVTDMVAAIQRAATLANISTTDVDRDLRIISLELTLNVVVITGRGAKVELKIPFIGMPLSFGGKTRKQNTNTLTMTLVPPDLTEEHEVRAGGDVEDTLVEAIETIRDVVAQAAVGDDTFTLRDSSVELSFAVTDHGSVALVGSTELSDEVTHLLKVTLASARTAGHQKRP